MKKPGPKGHTARTPTDVDRLVGMNVRKLRTAQGMTLVELSKELGISHQQRQKYETGANRLTAGILMNLSGILGVPLVALFENVAGADTGPKTRIDRSRTVCHRVIDHTPSGHKLDMMASVLKVIHHGILK